MPLCPWSAWRDSIMNSSVKISWRDVIGDEIHFINLTYLYENPKKKVCPSHSIQKKWATPENNIIISILRVGTYRYWELQYFSLSDLAIQKLHKQHCDLFLLTIWDLRPCISGVYLSQVLFPLSILVFPALIFLLFQLKSLVLIKFLELC